MLHQFKQFIGYSGTIHTNANCLLKCSYCYEFNKLTSIADDKKFWDCTIHRQEAKNYDCFNKKCDSKNHVISIDVAKKFIDQLLDFDKTDFFENYINTKNGLVLDFIGGDSLQYPELLDEILTYFVEQLIVKNHKMLFSWTVGISSNGVTLLNPKARAFCKKWKNNLSLGISVDGCPELHDLNRWCFADNEDGSHRGSWQYIKEIWPWYKKTFPEDSLRTKWTLVPNSYKYLYKSVKFLHEELGMKYVHFNRAMEDNILDTPEQLWEMLHQFEQVVDYAIQHHVDLACDAFGYNFTAGYTRQAMLQKDSNWSRCGFGKTPTVSLDGNIYPCFRMLPGNNYLKDVSKYIQGTVYSSIMQNQETLKQLNINSSATKMIVKDKCENCKIFTLCPHCAADCVNENQLTLTKTISVCNYTKLQVYYAWRYWERIKQLYPSIYKNYKIIWEEDETIELLQLVLEDIVNLKNMEENNDNC